jgi:splicing factor 3A subunit 2
MSAFEQRLEVANDKFQYLLVSAEPYEVIGFKIPNSKIDNSPGAFLTHWNAETCVFTIQFSFKGLLTAGAPQTGATAGAIGYD